MLQRHEAFVRASHITCLALSEQKIAPIGPNIPVQPTVGLELLLSSDMVVGVPGIYKDVSVRFS